MEEELSFLRRKVNRLEDMIFNINDKIGLILEKFLNHRASHVAGIREVLQVEEDICLSLVTQLKSCIISSSNQSDNRNSTISSKTQPTLYTKTRSNAGQPAAAPAVNKSVAGPALPRVVLTRQTFSSPGTGTRSTRVSSATVTPNKKRRQITDDDDESDPDQDPLIHLEKEDSPSNSNQQNLFTIKVESDLAFHPEEEDGGQDLERAEAEGQGSEGEPEPYNSSDEGEEESDKDDPDFNFRTQSGSGSTSINPNPKKAFIVSRSFDSLEEAKTQLKVEDQFRVNSSMYTSTGTKLYYICKYDVRCPVKINLVVNESTGAVDEYVSPDPPPHKHRQKICKSGGLPKEVKAVVDEIYFRSGMYGGDLKGSIDKLQKELIRRGFEEHSVPKHKIKNYLSRLKKKKYGDLSFMRARKPKPISKSSVGSNLNEDRPGRDQGPGDRQL